MIQIKVLSQVQNKSVLTNSKYLENPKKYLSKIDSTKISSGILIDRTFFNDLVLNVNGNDLVTVIDNSQWTKIYNTMKDAVYDTAFFIGWKTMNLIIENYYRSRKTHCISLLDFTFNKIKQEALTNSELIEENDFLNDTGATIHSYSQHRAVAASCRDFNITGDNINFIVKDLFYFTNNKTQKLKTLEIDFGNGEGYKTVNFNETINVNYDSNSGYLELKARMTFVSYSSHESEVLYSHFSVYRTGTSTVPLPDNPHSGSNMRTSNLETDGGLLYYPVGVQREEIITVIKIKEGCFYPPDYPDVCIPVLLPIAEQETLYHWEGRELEYNFLFSPNNNSEKLRRPFMLVDGFDPGNIRDYFQTHIDCSDEDILPYDKDCRGLFQILNGDPSPWYPNDPGVNLVQALQNDGYDIIFVNFLSGSGDIPSNANSIRNFLNNVINSNTYRDNKTEEIVLVGPSMGGLITRYALTSMEQADPKEDHFVKTWISFDGPHKGANIPIGLQLAIKFLTKIHDGGIGAIAQSKIMLKNNLVKLNTPAARQMLLTHFEYVSDQAYHTPDFDNFYAQLDQLGYPRFAKNYAISNGGKELLYSGTGTEILSFELLSWTWVKAWGLVNYDGNFKIFEGSRQGLDNDETVKVGNQIAYDNAPGGWYTALYSMNFNTNNGSVDLFALRAIEELEGFELEQTVPYKKATFMVTPSAFGMPITRDNVNKTWEAFTGYSDNTSGKIKTPFDEVHGMEKNEEHIKISDKTKNYLIKDVLRNDFENSQRPRIREGQTSIQTVNGNVAYLAKNNITFAGNGNSFTVKNGADVNILSGKTIRFLPGFKVERGAKFHASIGTVDYNTTLRLAQTPLKPANYSKLSPYTGKIYNYKEDEIPVLTFNPVNLSIYPNPILNYFQIESDDIGQGLINFEIFNSTGQRVYFSTLINNHKLTIDVSKFSSGVYLLKTDNGFQNKIYKFIKF